MWTSLRFVSRRSRSTGAILLTPFGIEFSNAVEPFSFGIDAYLLADEIPEERINELHIVVADPFNDVSPTAQDIDHLLDQWAALNSAPDG